LNIGDNEALTDQAMTRTLELSTIGETTLSRKPEAITWEEKPVDVPDPAVEEDASGLTAH
jgi:hypothetical protein